MSKWTQQVPPKHPKETPSSSISSFDLSFFYGFALCLSVSNILYESRRNKGNNDLPALLHLRLPRVTKYFPCGLSPHGEHNQINNTAFFFLLLGKPVSLLEKANDLIVDCVSMSECSTKLPTRVETQERRRLYSTLREKKNCRETQKVASLGNCHRAKLKWVISLMTHFVTRATRGEGGEETYALNTQLYQFNNYCHWPNYERQLVLLTQEDWATKAGVLFRWFLFFFSPAHFQNWLSKISWEQK